MFSIDIKNLKPGLKKLTDEYSFFISASSLDDSLNLTQLKNYLTDKRVQELYEICLKKYPNVTDLETSFTEIFKKYKTFFPIKISLKFIRMFPIYYTKNQLFMKIVF